MTVPSTLPTPVAAPAQPANDSGSSADQPGRSDFSTLLAALTGTAGTPVAALGQPVTQPVRPTPQGPDGAQPDETAAIEPSATPAAPNEPGKPGRTRDDADPVQPDTIPATLPTALPTLPTLAAMAAPPMTGAQPQPAQTRPTPTSDAPSATDTPGVAPTGSTAARTTIAAPSTVNSAHPSAHPSAQPAQSQAHLAAGRRSSSHEAAVDPATTPTKHSTAVATAMPTGADPSQPQTTQPTPATPPVSQVAPVSAPTPVAAAAAATAPTVTHALHAQPQLSDAVAHLRTRGTGSHQLDVALHPAELGAVHVRATLHGDTLTVTVSCADDAARQAVSAALPDLHQALGGLGSIDVDLRDAGHRNSHPSADRDGTGGDDRRDPSAHPDHDDRPRPRSLRADGLDRWM